MSNRIHFMTIFIALALIFSAQKSFAIIDMRNANYSDTWVDLQVKNSAYDLRMQRTYNSRTLYSGLIGFGWCTDYETSLKVTAENTIRVTECGAGFEIDYLPAGATGDSLSRNVEKIMAEVKKRNKGRPAEYFANLENDIRRDSALRDEFAKELKINGSVKENAKYLAEGRATDSIIFKGGEYIRSLANGTVQKFNKDGQLIQVNDKNGNSIKLAYKGDRLVSVNDSTGASLQFKYHDNSKFVKTVSGPNGLSSAYKYKGETLVEVTNAGKVSFRYEYDDLYNLTKVTYPDKSTITISYNKDKDWVTGYTDRRGCKESYNYLDNEKDPLNNYTSTVEKVCGGKVTNKSKYEFWYETNKGGRRFLARTKSIVNGKIVETTYHEQFGRPVEIVEDGIISRFDYFPNGQLMRKSNSNSTYSYKYENSCSKVSQVNVLVSYPTGIDSSKPAKDRKPSKVENKKFTTEFMYDPRRCNLLAAKNSFGQTVNLSYDQRGRITKIIDQSKKEVTITYEERFGKPSIVSRPGLGTIKFKYNTDGTVDKFDTDDDPLVASQVLNIFSNMLEIIAPATTETNNI